MFGGKYRPGARDDAADRTLGATSTERSRHGNVGHRSVGHRWVEVVPVSGEETMEIGPAILILFFIGAPLLLFLYLVVRVISEAWHSERIAAERKAARKA